MSVKNSNDLTPFDIARRNGNSEAANYLKLVSNVPKNAQKIETAIRSGNLDTVKRLLGDISDKNPIIYFERDERTGNTIPYTVLHLAAHLDKLEIVKYVITKIENKNPVVPSSKEGRKHFLLPFNHI